jgi:hypothetical protein
MRPRDAVALVLATCAGLSVLALTLAGLYDALADPAQAGISEAYSSLITGTLGVLVGALAGYIGGRHDLESGSAGVDPKRDETAGRDEQSAPEPPDPLSGSNKHEGPTP